MAYDFEYEQKESLPTDMTVLDSKGNVIYDGFSEASADGKNISVRLVEEKLKKGQIFYAFLNGDSEPREVSFDTKINKFSVSEQIDYNKSLRLGIENERVTKPKYSILDHLKNLFHRWFSDEDLPEIKEYKEKYAEYEKSEKLFNKGNRLTNDLSAIERSLNDNKFLDKRPITLFDTEKVKYRYNNGDNAEADLEKLRTIEKNMAQIATINVQKIKSLCDFQDAKYLTPENFKQCMICLTNLLTLDDLNKEMQKNSLSSDINDSGNKAMKELMDGAGDTAKYNLKLFNSLSMKTKCDMINMISTDGSLQGSDFISSATSPEVTTKINEIFEDPEEFRKELDNMFTEVKEQMRNHVNGADIKLIGKAFALKQMYIQSQKNEEYSLDEAIQKMDKLAETYANEAQKIFTSDYDKVQAQKELKELFNLSYTSKSFDDVNKNIADRKQQPETEIIDNSGNMKKIKTGDSKERKNEESIELLNGGF